MPRLRLPESDLADPARHFLDVWVPKRGLCGLVAKSVLRSKQYLASHARWLVLLCRPNFGKYR